MIDLDAIRKTLTGDGSCTKCEGSGTEYWDASACGSAGHGPCGRCNSTGRDPEALLRSVQAVGLLLLHLVEKGNTP